MPLDLATVACVEGAFAALATKPVVMPPILRLDIPEHRGEVDVKTAYVPGLSGFAIKISPGFFDNPKFGLPSLNGMMVLLSAHTGLVSALLLDNGYLTDVRTGRSGRGRRPAPRAPGRQHRRHPRRRHAGAAAVKGSHSRAAGPRSADLARDRQRLLRSRPI